MSDQIHLSDLGHEDQFEREMRGYSRRAVDEYVAGLRIELRSLEDARRDLEDRLSRALDEGERLKLELSSLRANGKPPHQEISERIGQILKLADDEARSQRTKADEEIGRIRAEAQNDTAKLRADAKAETDKSRAEAHEQAERMLSAAQEQADSTVATAKSEAETTRKNAAAEAQQVVTDASKQAETAVTTAKSQAKQQLDEATARATAIHDGAERRLNLLMSRHTDALRRLTEIRDVVTTLVAGETDRGSLEDEVARIVAGTLGTAGSGSSASNGGAEGGRQSVSRPAGPQSQPPAGAGLPGRSGQSGAGPASQAGPTSQAGPASQVGPARIQSGGVPGQPGGTSAERGQVPAQQQTTQQQTAQQQTAQQQATHGQPGQPANAGMQRPGGPVTPPPQGNGSGQQAGGLGGIQRSPATGPREVPGPARTPDNDDTAADITDTRE